MGQDCRSRRHGWTVAQGFTDTYDVGILLVRLVPMRRCRAQSRRGTYSVWVVTSPDAGQLKADMHLRCSPVDLVRRMSMATTAPPSPYQVCRVRRLRSFLHPSSAEQTTRARLGFRWSKLPKALLSHVEPNTIAQLLVKVPDLERSLDEVWRHRNSLTHVAMFLDEHQAVYVVDRHDGALEWSHKVEVGQS